MSEKLIKIEIPCDEGGYCLLQCPKCGDYFKLKPAEFQDEAVLEIWCPCCGLVSDSYLTQEVIEVVRAKAMNYCLDELHSTFKDLERTSKGEAVSFKAGKVSKHEPENRILNKVDSMVTVHFACCKKSAKVSPCAAMSVRYCSFCGVISFESK